MTFDGADPHEIGKSGSDQVDRSRGAAKAITVSDTFNRRVLTDYVINPGVHRSRPEMGRHILV